MATTGTRKRNHVMLVGLLCTECCNICKGHPQLSGLCVLVQVLEEAIRYVDHEIMDKPALKS